MTEAPLFPLDVTVSKSDRLLQSNEQNTALSKSPPRWTVSRREGCGLPPSLSSATVMKYVGAGTSGAPQALWDRAHDNPTEVRTGWFVGRLRKRGPFIPASIQRINHEPDDPENVLDTGPILVATIGLYGDADPFEVCAMWELHHVPKREYDFQLARLKYARDYAPHERNPGNQ